MARRRSVVSSTLTTFAVNVGTAAVSLVNVLLVSRLLGPAGRGEVVFLMTIATMTSRFSALGIQEANVNIASAEPRLRGHVATNSLLLAVALGWTGAAIVFGIGEIFPGFTAHSDPTLRLVALAAVPLLALQGFLLRLVHADYRFGYANMATFAPPVFNVVVVGVLAATGTLTVTSALLAWVGAALVGVLMLATYTHASIARFARPRVDVAKRMLGFGIRSHLGRVMAVGNYRLDQWFVGSFAGNRELGLYSVAVAWFEALTYLPTALAVVLRPDIVRATPREAAARTAAAFRATILLTAAFVAISVVAAPVLCVTIFGEEFRGSIDDLRAIAFGAFGIMAVRLFGSALAGQGKPLLETAGIGFGLVFTVLLDILLIPAHGGFGAALASAFSYGAAGAATAALFARSLGASWGDLRPRLADVKLLSDRTRALVRRRS